MARADPPRLLPPTVPDLIMLSYTIAGQAMAPFIPLYAQGLGMDNRSIGLLLAIPGFGALLASLFAGAWLARLGAKRLILAAALVATTSLAVVWGRASVVAFAVFMSLFWAVQPLVAIASQVMVVTRPSSSGQDRVVGMHAFYVSLGVSIGPLLGSAAVHTTGRLASVFLLGAAVSAAAGMIALRAPEREPVPVARGVTFLAGLRNLPLAVKASFVAIMVAEFCYVGWGTFFPIALKGTGRTPEAIGLVFTLHGVMLSTVRTTLARLVRRLGRPGVLGASLLSIGAGLWMSTMPGLTALPYGAAVLLGVGFGLVFPITIIMVSAASAADLVGRTLAARFFMITVGEVLGPFVAGMIAGLSLTGAMAAIAMVATTTALWVLALRRTAAAAFLDTAKSAMLR